MYHHPKPIVDALKKAGPSKGVMQVADGAVSDRRYAKPEVGHETSQ